MRDFFRFCRDSKFLTGHTQSHDRNRRPSGFAGLAHGAHELRQNR